MHKFSAFALLMASAAGPALALDFGDGFYATGEFVLEYLDGSGFSGETFAYGTVDVGYEQAGGGFGGFVGFDSFALDNLSETAVYGALTYSGSFGKVQIGVPRAALDDYIDTPDLGGSSLFDLELSTLSGSILPVVYLTSDIDTPVGLRYDGSFGAANVGVSYHSIEDIDILDLGVNYQIGQVELRGGVEHAHGNGLSETSYFLGAEGAFGPVVAGALYSDVRLSGNVDSLQLYATYTPIDALDLTATYLTISSGGTDQDFYGLAAAYTFNQGVYVEAGYLDGISNEIFNASLGVKF